MKLWQFGERSILMHSCRLGACLSDDLPNLKWAQTSDSIYINVDILEATNVDVEIAAKVLRFRAETGGKVKQVSLYLFKVFLVLAHLLQPTHSSKQETTYTITLESVRSVLRKMELNNPWMRLLVSELEFDWIQRMGKGETIGFDQVCIKCLGLIMGTSFHVTYVSLP